MTFDEKADFGSVMPILGQLHSEAVGEVCAAGLGEALSTLLWATFLALAGLQNGLSKRKWDDAG